LKKCNFEFLGVKSGEVLLHADLLKDAAGHAGPIGNEAKVKGIVLKKEGENHLLFIRGIGE
jgi:hypothetical protein